MDVSDLHAKAAHNYSIQSLNSTELAKEKLRHVLSKVKEYFESHGGQKIYVLNMSVRHEIQFSL